MSARPQQAAVALLGLTLSLVLAGSASAQGTLTNTTTTPSSPTCQNGMGDILTIAPGAGPIPCVPNSAIQLSPDLKVTRQSMENGTINCVVNFMAQLTETTSGQMGTFNFQVQFNIVLTPNGADWANSQALLVGVQAIPPAPPGGPPNALVLGCQQYTPGTPGSPTGVVLMPPTSTSPAMLLAPISCECLQPVIMNCPPNMTVSCTASPIPPPPSVAGMPTAFTPGTNMCPTTITFTDTPASTTPPPCPAVAVINRTFTATNICGGTASCTQQFTVVDDTTPTITCPPDTTVPCNASTDVSKTGDATAFEQPCGPSMVKVSHTDSTAPAACPNVSEIIRTFFATDTCSGKTATCTQHIFLADVPPTVACPPGITETGNSSCQATVPDLCKMATESSPCGLPLTCTQIPAAGSTVTGPGTFPIKLTVTDGCLSGSCVTTLTVNCPVVTACTASSSITSNFNGTAIPAGDTIWFNSVLKVSGLGSAPVHITLTNASVQLGSQSVSVPDATITFDPKATSATTSFVGGTWVTRVPSFGLAGSTFLSGVGIVSPGLPGGINPVTWSGTFSSDTPGVKIQWQWAAAVYTSFSPDPNGLGVKPVDDNRASQYQNSDHAGTPENFKSSVTGGARGGGGSNFTGSYSGTGSINCP